MVLGTWKEFSELEQQFIRFNKTVIIDNIWNVNISKGLSCNENIFNIINLRILKAVATIVRLILAIPTFQWDI